MALVFLERNRQPGKRLRLRAKHVDAICWLAALLAGLSFPLPVKADSGLSVSADRTLEFGSFVVLTSGSKWVHASGLVADQGVWQLPGSAGKPAQFTISYQRGGGRTPADIVLLIAIAKAPPITVGTVTATISALDTDLAGAPALDSGQAITYTMPGCAASCSVSFRVGARLDIVAATTGARLSLPLAVTAQVIAGN